MIVSKEKLLNELPPYTDEWLLVKEKQRVPDIIKLICEKHISFAHDYDAIGPYFVGSDIEDTCNNLYDFCKQNLRYVEESEEFQSVGNPASILSRGESGIDCKSYALFIGGCIDAISRTTGEKIKWHYCFASYEPMQKIPYHVFVVVETSHGSLYVDPTPGSENKEPFWITDRAVQVTRKKSLGVVGNLAGTADIISGSYGELIPAPQWYPANLPLFYRSNGEIILRPINSVPKYTQNDVLDCCLYLQTIIGYNRIDYQNARSAAWEYTDKQGGAQIWVKSAFKSDAMGDGGGNFANISNNNQSIDGGFYSQLQQRYVQNEKAAMPWLSAMQAKSGGIDLLTLPMATDVQLPRPSWYADYLPSLFTSAGLPNQRPAGWLDTKPKIRDGKSSGYTQYTVTPNDVAELMVYAQPVILNGPTPYPLNWFINDDVNGAMFAYFKITLDFTAGHTNSQMQMRSLDTDMMQEPELAADPYTSAFSHTLQTIVSAAINFFAGKIPGGTKAVQAAYLAGSIGGGEFITGGPMPAGQFSAAVFTAADGLITAIKKKTQLKSLLLIALLAAGLGWYYWGDIKKQI